MPTHRNEGELDIGKLFLNNINFIENFLQNNNIVLYIKLHYYHMKNMTQIDYSNIKLLFDDDIEQDIYSIINTFDLLITDYSSIYFDYLLANKPIIFAPFDYEEYIKLKLLGEILLETNSSPLKKAILSSNLCEDFSWYVERDLLFSNLSIIFHNSKKEYKDKLKKLVDSELKRLVKNGINKELIESVINRFEIGVREDRSSKTRVPKGIKYFRDIATVFFYEGDIIATLKYEDTLTKIKGEYKNKLFEKLIEKYLLNSKKKGFVVLEPTLKSLQQIVEKDLVTKFKELKEENKIRIIKEQEEFKKFQNRKSKETLELLNSDEVNLEPINSVKLEKKIINLENANIDKNEILILTHSSDTKKINYLSMYFDITNLINHIDININLERLQYVELLKEIFDEVKTKNYNYDSFSNFINKNTGGIDFSIEVIENLKKKYEELNRNKNFSKGDESLDVKNLEIKKVKNNGIGKEDIKIYFKMTVKFLEEKREKVLEILNEYLNNVIFEDSKIEEIIRRIKNNLEIEILEDGDYYAFLKNSSQYSVRGKISELINGVSFILFIRKLNERFLIDKRDKENKDKISKLRNKLFDLYKDIFQRENLEIVTLLKDKNVEFDINEVVKKIVMKEKSKEDFVEVENKKEMDKENFRTDLTTFGSRNNEIGEIGNKDYSLNLGPKKNYAVATSSSVLYNSKGFNLFNFNINYIGSIKLLGTLLKSQYLMEEIRFRGGAYGLRTKAERDGDFFFFSYRDPNLERTYKKYDEALNFIMSLSSAKKGDNKRVHKAILATISKLDYPEDIFTKFEKSVYNYLIGIGIEDLRREKVEVVEADLEELKSFGEKILDILKKSSYCSVGNKNIIEKNRNLFDEIIKL